MKDNNNKKPVAIVTLVASAIFFILGFMYPLLQTGFGIGPFTIKKEYVYISTSFRYFFDQGEVFIGMLLLFFTIIFPIIKYIFLFITLLGHKTPRHHFMNAALEIINKWAMLDVFVVAVLILNMKFDSTIIVSKLESGTTLFAISVILLMTSSLITSKLPGKKEKLNSF
ncbi:MAG: paraquat-inducible protein A [Chitinophagaceae bacterium]|nr:paraquat-inducible protein A [Chitinophagaceae bacterium]MBK7679295.1 paraquat-inducible protein A [Chitinophagaceae bacterium]MBK9659467.1 paraquat-inducible protein A [Chitinophagaceae bacterium]HQW44560.1 paraquat-inducible protein A [Chitinophagaceae bacterium]